MIAQNVRHALARAVAPQCDGDALAAACNAPRALSPPRKRCGPAGRAPQQNCGLARLHLDRRAPALPCGTENGVSRASGDPLDPSRHSSRSDRAGRAATACRGGQTRVARAPAGVRRNSPATCANRSRAASSASGSSAIAEPGTIIEQRLELLVEQGQPMFHAGMSPTLAHGVIKQIVRSGRTKSLDIAQPEPLDRIGRELEFGDGNEIEAVQLARRALALRIEGADALQSVPEEVEPDRLAVPGA